MGAQKSAKTLYEEFFVGEEGTQYFIKPLVFISDNSESIELDITFRYKNEIKDSAIINFSLYREDALKNIDSIKILNSKSLVLFENVSLLFISKEKDQIKYRFTTSCLFKDIYTFFSNPQWEINVFFNGQKSTYIPPKKTVKKINSLNNNIFVLF